jgi:hypothetical protein
MWATAARSQVPQSLALNSRPFESIKHFSISITSFLVFFPGLQYNQNGHSLGEQTKTPASGSAGEHSFRRLASPADSLLIKASESYSK